MKRKGRGGEVEKVKPARRRGVAAEDDEEQKLETAAAGRREKEKKEEKKEKSLLMSDVTYINWAYPCPPLDSVSLLDSRLAVALGRMGITQLLPVQMEVWKQIIGWGFDRDLCINSPTGSGKTISYALPIVQALSTRAKEGPRALVVLPTRDLAVQVQKVFAALASAVHLSVGLAVGQSSIAGGIAEIMKKPILNTFLSYGPMYVPQKPKCAVDILVATPGRLMDHINNTEGFTLKHLEYLVVDEADKLLRETYQSWLPTVIQLADFRRYDIERGFKGPARLEKMVLSATLTQDPSKLAQLNLHNPLLITSGKRRYQLPEQLQSFKLVCEPEFKPLYLLALLETLQGQKSIVFTSSVESTHRLCTLLNCFNDLHIKIEEYSRCQRQSTRSKTLRAFRAGEVQVLISSDAMSRGMDVEGVKNVINYDMPPFIKTYIHRAGRTARAGKAGSCFTLLHNGQVNQFNKLLEKAARESCPIYSVSSDIVELLHAKYSAALERLKVSVESEKFRDGMINRSRRRMK